MKILTLGKVPEIKLYKGTCGCCGSVIEADHREINHSHDGHHIGVCPVCDSRMAFYSEDTHVDQSKGTETGSNFYVPKPQV